MSEPIRCRACGADLSDERTAAVEAAIDGWIASGALSPSHAAVLRSGAAQGRHQRFTPGVALLAVGGVFVVSAAIMVVANLWDKMGTLGRLAAVILPMVGLYMAALALDGRGQVNRLVTALVALFASLLVPIAAWIVVCEVRMPFTCVLHGELGNAEPARVCIAALISLAVHAGTLWRFRHPVLTLPVCVSALFVLPAAAEWLVPHRGSGIRVSLAILITGAAVMAAGQMAARRGRWQFAVVPDVIGSLVALMATTVIGADLGRAWEIVAGAAPLAMIALGCHPQRQRYLIAGMLFLVINIFRIGLERFGQTAGLPVTLLVCGAATMTAGYAVHRLRREFAA